MFVVSGVVMKNEWKCVEAEDEPDTETTESLFQVGCYISQGKQFDLRVLISVDFKVNRSIHTSIHQPVSLQLDNITSYST